MDGKETRLRWARKAETFAKIQARAREEEKPIATVCMEFIQKVASGKLVDKETGKPIL